MAGIMEEDIFAARSIFDDPKKGFDLLHSRISKFTCDAVVRSRGQLIEKKMDILENLASKVSNRRSRRWLNDRFLIELVPRLNAEEIRGLFAPPPWGDDTPLSAFSKTNTREWDAFRNVDMDFEVSILKSLTEVSAKRKGNVETDKMIALNAWRRVDRGTREVMRRRFLPELIESYEDRIRTFIKESEDGEVLMLYVQDPFCRLLLHGVCEFYNLISITDSITMDAKLQKATRIKKKLGHQEVLPNITLAKFLRMAKDGAL